MKNLLIIFSIALFSVNGIAQTYKLGVYVEPSVGWLHPERQSVRYEAAAVGFGGGISFDYYFTDKYAFSSGIGLSTQGGELKYDDSIRVYVYDETADSPDNVVLKYNLNYINIPLGLKLKTDQLGYFTYFFDLGFDLQVSISAKGTSLDGEDFDFTAEDNRPLDNDDISKEINFMNISYHFGGGLEYELSESTAFFAGLTYRNGFTDITANEYQNYTVNTRVVALRVGLMF